jgi:regulator of protease activity HflC (stomatin/prohibitin superfamily)
MTELARFLIELLTTLWPLREVQAWSKGVRFWLNRPVAVLSPGVHWVVPYFGDVRDVSVVPAVITTPLSTITLGDGATCTYSLSATIAVTDPQAALCEIDDYMETSQELITSIPAEALADMDVGRLAPEARGRLLASLRTRVNTELRRYGMEVSALRFTNFALNLRTYRLLTDSSGLPAKW